MALPRDELARRTRRLLIDVAQRRQKPGSGSILKLTEWSNMERWPDLAPVLSGLRWAIAGAVATRMYMPERATQDIDAVVLAPDIAAAKRRLLEAGYVELGPLSIGGNSFRAQSGQMLDVISVEGELWQAGLRAASENLDPAGSPVLTLPFLVLMKLESGRVQDVADVSRMLGFADAAALDEVRALIARHARDMTADLESIIELGKLEHDGTPDR
jgi:hypothetical protein